MPTGQSTNPFQSNNPYKLRRLTITWNPDRIWRMVVEVVKSKSNLHNDIEDSCLADFKAKNLNPLPNAGGDPREISTDVNCQNLKSIKITKNDLYGISKMEFVHEDGNVQMIELSTEYLLQVYRRKAEKKFFKNSQEIKDIEAAKQKMKSKSSQQAKIELMDLEKKLDKVIEEHRERSFIEERNLFQTSEQCYEVRQEITPGNYLEFDFFPLDIKFNKNNLEDFVPGDLNRIDEVDPRQESIIPAQLQQSTGEMEEEEALSDNSDDIEVSYLGKEKDG